MKLSRVGAFQFIYFKQITNNLWKENSQRFYATHVKKETS